MQSFTRTIP
uniref:Uncharacterized protein n=1 Tax=Rhizophora mucronata TaxID=61149 RepID=A0A2P2IWC5_RHIMU